MPENVSSCLNVMRMLQNERARARARVTPKRRSRGYSTSSVQLYWANPCAERPTVILPSVSFFIPNRINGDAHGPYTNESEAISHQHQINTTSSRHTYNGHSLQLFRQEIWISHKFDDLWRRLLSSRWVRPESFTLEICK